MIKLCSTHIAGVFYYIDAAQLEKRAIVGKNLGLKREPDNKHDNLAIAVIMRRRSGTKKHTGETRIGHIPATVNQPYAALMDAGFVLFAQITEVIARSSTVIVDICMSEKHGRGALKMEEDAQDLVVENRSTGGPGGA